jgi:hypothetical protein
MYNTTNKNNEPEIWKDIKGYEGSYQVSDKGRVRSLDRESVQNRGSNSPTGGRGLIARQLKGKILSLVQTGGKNKETGEGVYLQVNIYKKTVRSDGVPKYTVEKVYVHRVVAAAFIPNSEDKPCVDHINRDEQPSERDEFDMEAGFITPETRATYLDNRACNLRWCTASENQQNAKKKRYRYDVKPSSKYKGVAKRTHQGRKKPWCAQLKVNGKYRYVGTFVTEREAALAYDKVAAKEFGEFANLNF